MTISPFDSDREVSRDDIQPGNRYRMAFSLDGGATYRVRNVACEIDNQGSRRIRWCDELWQAYPPTNGADIGLLVDQMDELVRFELVPSLPDLLSAENRKRSIERINSSDPVRVVERVANSLSIENRLAKHEERERGERERRIERERFEQWMQTQTAMPGCDLKRGGGEYAWIIVQLAWEAWQAGQKDTRKDLEHLERKVAHGCTDANCEECDQ